jgi:hypothetical protein
VIWDKSVRVCSVHVSFKDYPITSYSALVSRDLAAAGAVRVAERSD